MTEPTQTPIEENKVDIIKLVKSEFFPKISFEI